MKHFHTIKTKRVTTGVYNVTTPNEVYQIESNEDRADGTWDLSVKDNGHFEIMDVCSSLREAKEVIIMIETRDYNNLKEKA